MRLSNLIHVGVVSSPSPWQHTNTMVSQQHLLQYTEMDQRCLQQWRQGLEEFIASVSFIIPALTLIVFNIVVIGGNLLVIMSVFSCNKLRTITNTYVVSLAFSDLFLGILVLPFSGTQEVLRLWPFGGVWCHMWLAIDVWICTASILNLCAISFDRYLAISRPFKYQALVSPAKAKMLVGTVWLVAFLICLPPLIGWNEQGTSLMDKVTEEDEENMFTVYNKTYSSTPIIYRHNKDEMLNTAVLDNGTTTTVIMPDCQAQKPCELNSEPGYVIYSALGSFWIPVWIMVFFYTRIYMIAAKTTKGNRTGVIHAKSNGSSTGASSPVTLRIHRGGALNSSQTSRCSSHRPSFSQTESLLPSACPSPNLSNGAQRVRQHSYCDTEENAGKIYKQLKRNASVPTNMMSDADLENINENNNNAALNPVKPPPKIKVSFCRNSNNKRPTTSGKSSKLPEYKGPSTSYRNGVAHCPIEEETSFNMSETCLEDGPNFENSRRLFRRRNLRTKIRSFNREKKAAKTVGIIVGCFICCWAPFFTAYLLSAFCVDCTPDLLFTIFFWLGYSNSAINPFVYALFSKDFRFAFRKLLTCRCEQRPPSFSDRRASKFRTFLNSLKIQISSRSSDETNFDC